jgi:hypothetical protein
MELPSDGLPLLHHFGNCFENSITLAIFRFSWGS